MAVIETEMKRCKEIVPTLTDDDLIEAMEDRIDVLQMTADSISSDIQNEFLTQNAYLDQCKAYYKYELANLKKA
jgi:hypothetical protein